MQEYTTKELYEKFQGRERARFEDANSIPIDPLSASDGRGIEDAARPPTLTIDDDDDEPPTSFEICSQIKILSAQFLRMENKIDSLRNDLHFITQRLYPCSRTRPLGSIPFTTVNQRRPPLQRDDPNVNTISSDPSPTDSSHPPRQHQRMSSVQRGDPDVNTISSDPSPTDSSHPPQPHQRMSPVQRGDPNVNTISSHPSPTDSSHPPRQHQRMSSVQRGDSNVNTISSHPSLTDDSHQQHPTSSIRDSNTTAISSHHPPPTDDSHHRHRQYHPTSSIRDSNTTAIPSHRSPSTDDSNYPQHYQYRQHQTSSIRDSNTTATSSHKPPPTDDSNYPQHYQYRKQRQKSSNTKTASSNPSPPLGIDYPRQPHPDDIVFPVLELKSDDDDDDDGGIIALKNMLEQYEEAPNENQNAINTVNLLVQDSLQNKIEAPIRNKKAVTPDSRQWITEDDELPDLSDPTTTSDRHRKRKNVHEDDYYSQTRIDYRTPPKKKKRDESRGERRERRIDEGKSFDNKKTCRAERGLNPTHQPACASTKEKHHHHDAKKSRKDSKTR